MPGFIEITPWHWAGFILCALIYLAFDLGVFHCGARVVKFKEAPGWSTMWLVLAIIFSLLVVAAILLISITLSVTAAPRGKKVGQ